MDPAVCPYGHTCRHSCLPFELFVFSNNYLLGPQKSKAKRFVEKAAPWVGMTETRLGIPAPYEGQWLITHRVGFTLKGI